jgi:hypothetical protein
MLRNLITFAIVTLTPAMAFAQDVVAPEGATELVTALVEAFKGGNWHVFASVVVMAIVWVLTKAPFFSDLIKGKGKVWVAAICGMLMAVATTVFTTGDWMAALGNGLSIGLGATGLFELVRRKISKQPIDADGDGVLDVL